MANLRRATQNFNNSRWDESFKDDLFGIPNKATRVRLFEKIAVIHQHYVEFYSEKRKSNSGFYELCLNWDSAKEDDNAVDGGCPLCAAGLKPTEHYYAFLIHRAAQKKGLLQVQPVRLTAKCAGDIARLSETVYPDLPEEEAPLATDPTRGFDIYIRVEVQNKKTTYTVNQVAVNAADPLTPEELEAFTEYVGDHDIGALAKPRPRKEVTEKLMRLGVIDGGGAGKEQAAPERSLAAGKKPETRKYESYDTEEVPPAKPVAEKRASLTGPADDDEEPAASAKRQPWDDDEEGPPPPKTGKRARQYATPDAAEAPGVDE